MVGILCKFFIDLDFEGVNGDVFFKREVEGGKGLWNLICFKWRNILYLLI